MIEFRLKQLMDEKEVSIKQLNEITGIPRNTLSNMINGRTNGIQFDNLNKLVESLECGVHELLKFSPGDFYFGFGTLSEFDYGEKHEDNNNASFFLVTENSRFFYDIFIEKIHMPNLDMLVIKHVENNTLNFNSKPSKHYQDNINRVFLIHQNIIHVFSNLLIRYLIETDRYTPDSSTEVMIVDHSNLPFNKNTSVSESIIQKNKEINETILSHYLSNIEKNSKTIAQYDDTNFIFKLSYINETDDQ